MDTSKEVRPPESRKSRKHTFLELLKWDTVCYHHHVSQMSIMKDTRTPELEKDKSIILKQQSLWYQSSSLNFLKKAIHTKRYKRHWTPYNLLGSAKFFISVSGNLALRKKGEVCRSGLCILQAAGETLRGVLLEDGALWEESYTTADSNNLPGLHLDTADGESESSPRSTA